MAAMLRGAERRRPWLLLATGIGLGALAAMAYVQHATIQTLTAQLSKTSAVAAASAATLEAAARSDGGRTRYALCFFGLTRSVAWTIDSIRHHILAPLQAAGAAVRYDVFVHTYRVDTPLDNPRAGERGVAYANHFTDVQMLRPTRYLITSQDDFDQTYPDIHAITPLKWQYDEDATIRNIFRAQNSLSLVWSIMADHASEHKIDYAGVVLLRPDVLYLNDLDIVQLGELPENTTFIPSFQSYGGYNDRFAYGRPSAMRAYCNRLDTMVSRAIEAGASVNSEKLLVRHLRAHNVSVAPIDMTFARVRTTGGVPRKDTNLVLDACKRGHGSACVVWERSREVARQEELERLKGASGK
ncbi:hypothetical protein JKP88DRAFT_305179 [Tribonema minus]|uniref:DUF7796 domain-containing protein n=1 Tax=Tribonema minus TaxID=303371 RepID=A0A835Z6Q8_9STRA|nr:hypothetical protein JKP88DRAFT_305179 [Tribonema minus]